MAPVNDGSVSPASATTRFAPATSTWYWPSTVCSDGQLILVRRPMSDDHVYSAMPETQEQDWACCQPLCEQVAPPPPSGSPAPTSPAYSDPLCRCAPTRLRPKVRTGCQHRRTDWHCTDGNGASGAGTRSIISAVSRTATRNSVVRAVSAVPMGGT